MDAHDKPTARGRDRDAVLRLRRRQKLERYIAALCTGGGITLEVARFFDVCGVQFVMRLLMFGLL